MAAKKPDITQVLKYLEGELDAPAMHQLERAALDDPFLQDAIDGLESAASNQQAQLTNLNQRLQQRISAAKVRRMLPWKYYAAVASVLMVFSLGYLLWPKAGKNAEPLKVASVIPPAPVDHPAAALNDTLTSPVKQTPEMAALKKAAGTQQAISPSTGSTTAPANTSILNEERVEAADVKAVVNNTSVVSANDIAAANTNRVNGYVSKSAADSGAQAAAPGYLARNYNAKSKAVTFKADTIQHNLARLDARHTDSAVLREVTIGGKASTLTEKDIKTNLAMAQTLPGEVSGAGVTTPGRVNITVMSEYGLPLANTRIDVDGLKPDRQLQIQTDAGGRITLPANGQAALNIISPGYESKQVKTSGAGNLQVTLKAADTFLSETATGSYRAAKPVKIIKEAHPLMGWEGYYKYLNALALTDGTSAGTVELSFSVDAKGLRSNFHIIKGLNDSSNERAVNLIKNGPGWAADASGKTKTVRLRLHFSRQ